MAHAANGLDKPVGIIRGSGISALSFLGTLGHWAYSPAILKPSLCRGRRIVSTLRGLSGARDEFHLAVIVQNLKTLALRLIRPLPQPARA